MAHTQRGRPHTGEPRKTTCSVVLPPALWAEVGKQSEITGLSRSEIVRRIIARGLEAQERDAQAESVGGGE